MRSAVALREILIGGAVDTRGWPGVIYQIFVDAFARGASGRSAGRLRGGDLEGVRERLGHVAGLGADAIWLTPIFASESDHGYNVTDYFRVDPRLAPDGRQEAADELLESVVAVAHQHGIRVLLDLPLNHVAHEYDLGAIDPHRPPRARPARTRQEHGWARDLKYLDHDDESTREFLVRVATYWIERFGVDGYRYDYVHGIANEFWEMLYARLRSIRTDLFVIGEHWEDLGTADENARDIADRFDGVAGPCFDTLFDFPFRAAAVEALRVNDPSPLATVLDLCDRLYPRPASAMLDNHDTARIADWVDGDPRRIGLAIDLLASRTGPICLLYGTETGLRSGAEPLPSFDVSSRVSFDWDRLDAGLVERTRAAFAARRSAPALSEGRTIARAAAGPLFAELKEAPDGSRAAVLLNFSEHPLPAGADVSTVIRGSLRAEPVGGTTAVEIVDGRLATELPAYGGGLYPC